MSKLTINVAIADDHQLFREGIRLILESRPSMRLVVEAGNGQDLLNQLATLETLPDVVLLDLKMPVLDGMETTKLLKEQYPEVKILILTMLQQDDYILHLLDLGANGYLLKNSSATEVLEAVSTVVAKDFYFNEHISNVLLAGLKRKRKAPPKLNNNQNITDREREVLHLMCQEHTTQEIADKLFVSARTVETHRRNLMQKFEAKNTAGLVLRALKQGIVA